MPIGTSGNDTWIISRFGEVNSYDGLGGVDTIDFGQAPQSTFNLTKNADGSISVDSVSGASGGVVIQLKLTNIELLKFNSGSQTLDLTTAFGPPKPVINIINGTAGNDTLNGTPGVDSINAGAGDDRINGKGGNDTINAGPGTDTVVLDTPLADVRSYSYNAGVLQVTTGLGTTEMREFERVKLTNALFAFDTQAGGHVWQAASLYRAWFGALPGTADLSRWTQAADSATSVGELARQMLASFAPGSSDSSVVAHLYLSLAHSPAPAAELQSIVDLIGAGRTFANQAELYAWAAALALNTDGMVGFVGSIQALDPGFFP